MHWLTVPVDPALAMTVEHPIDCPTIECTVFDSPRAIGRKVDAPWCDLARLVTNHGVEHWFSHAEAAPDGYEADWRVALRPGCYPLATEIGETPAHVEFWDSYPLLALRVLEPVA